MNRMELMDDPLVEEEAKPGPKYVVTGLRLFQSKRVYIMYCATVGIASIAMILAITAVIRLSSEKGNVNDIQLELEKVKQELGYVKLQNFELNANLSTLTVEYLVNMQKNHLRDELTALVTTLNFGWFAPFNGYKYQKTTAKANWNASRAECQVKGADLAYVGVKNYDTRVAIMSALSLNEAWIGLHDIPAEGNWIWVDGTNATKEDALWEDGEPNSWKGRDEDCAVIGRKSEKFKTKDAKCTTMSIGLCEKKIE
ncbi:unnamed protein product [Clavelina lepadiformis]|uniref:C-type lectin domain-containing protein n=1 Tax=Clavelina lepadiformis TaxID=159417 RepID=A0ABP0FWI1_CLALP